MAQKRIDCFASAMSNSNYVCDYVKIPYEGHELPALFFAADPKSVRWPTIVFNGGYDSTKEESWFAIAAPALQRGYSVLAFDGPGQGAALREQRLYFRPDWEVVTPVVDYLVTRSEVDSEQLALFGWSMGGYLAARAVSVEHRFAAVVLDDGVYDLGSAFRQTTPAVAQGVLANSTYDGITSRVMAQVTNLSTGLKWGICNGMWTFSAKSGPEFLRLVNLYSMEGHCEKIKTPTLVLDAPEDHFLKGQPKLIYDKLSCKKKMVRMSNVEGGSTHCHMGAFGRLHQVVFDFLAEELNSKGEPSLE